MRIAAIGFVALILSFATTAESQTTNEYQTVLVTNWVKPGPYLRVFNGITYNVAYSKKWQKFQDWEGLGKRFLDADYETSHLCLGNYQIINNVTFITILREHFSSDPSNPSDPPRKTSTQDDHIVAVLNCPNPNQADYYCIKTKDILDAKGVAFRAYDCGVQATNLVPVVKKIKVQNP